MKKMLQNLGSCVMRLVSSTTVKDAPSGFRAFSRAAAIQMNVFDNYTYTLETIIQARAKDLVIENVDINVNPEMRKSRLFSNMFVYIRRSIFTMLRMFIVYRPFRFFTIIGLVFLFFGTVLGGRFLYYFITGTGQGHIQSLILASILLLTGVQVCLIAVLSELISINRKLLEDVQNKIDSCNVLIIDCVGILSAIYRYGDFAYIGGGFGAGIHNILEAAAYSIPVIFGPNHKKFKEARDLLKAGGAQNITDSLSLYSVVNNYVKHPESLKNNGNICGEYVRQNRGATLKIVKETEKEYFTTNNQ